MSEIIFYKTQNKSPHQISCARQTINISTSDLTTINELSQTKLEGIRATIIFQNKIVDNSILQKLAIKGCSVIQLNMPLVTKNFTVIDSVELYISEIIGEYSCVYILSDHEIVQKYITYFLKRISQNTYDLQKSAKSQNIALYQSNDLEEYVFAVEELEHLVSIVDSEQLEVERIVHSYSFQFNHYLGSLLEEILVVKRQYAEARRDESEYAEYEYNEAKQREEQFHEERASNAKEGYVELNEEEKTDLKKLYREAVLKCHPDKVNADMQDKASELTKQLNDSYRKQDIEAVKQILRDLKNGVVSGIMKAEEKTLEHLSKKLDYLNNKLHSKIQNLLANRQDKTFEIASTYQEDPEHFNNLKTELEKEYEFWSKQQSQRT